MNDELFAELKASVREGAQSSTGSYPRRVASSSRASMSNEFGPTTR